MFGFFAWHVAFGVRVAQPAATRLSGASSSPSDATAEQQDERQLPADALRKRKRLPLLQLGASWRQVSNNAL